MFLCRVCLAKRCDSIRLTSCSLRSLPQLCSVCSGFFWQCLPLHWFRLSSTNFICDRAIRITLRSIGKQPRWSKEKSDLLGGQAASLFISAACRDAARASGGNVCGQMLPASCRQLQAGSLCSPEIAITVHRFL